MRNSLFSLLFLVSVTSFCQSSTERIDAKSVSEISDSTFNLLLNKGKSFFESELVNRKLEGDFVYIYNETGCEGQGHWLRRGYTLSSESKEITQISLKSVNGGEITREVIKSNDRKLIKEYHELYGSVDGYYSQSSLVVRCTNSVIYKVKNGEITSATVSKGGLHSFDDKNFDSKEWKRLSVLVYSF